MFFVFVLDHWECLRRARIFWRRHWVPSVESRVLKKPCYSIILLPHTREWNSSKWAGLLLIMLAAVETTTQLLEGLWNLTLNGRWSGKWEQYVVNKRTYQLEPPANWEATEIVSGDFSAGSWKLKQRLLANIAYLQSQTTSPSAEDQVTFICFLRLHLFNALASPLLSTFA